MSMVSIVILVRLISWELFFLSPAKGKGDMAWKGNPVIHVNVSPAYFINLSCSFDGIFKKVKNCCSY